MAEGEGFEPPGPFPAQRFSRPPHSAALPPFRIRVMYSRIEISSAGSHTRQVALNNVIAVLQHPVVNPALNKTLGPGGGSPARSDRQFDYKCATFATNTVFQPYPSIVQLDKSFYDG